MRTLLLICLLSAAAPAVEELLRLPLAERQTAGHHFRLARAYQAAGQPGPAADALALAVRLNAGQSPDHKALRGWLDRQAEAAWSESAVALRSGDRARAVKAYLLSVKCDPSRAASAHPAKELARRTLEARVKGKPDDLEPRWQLACLLYRLGDDAPGSYHFAEHARREPDPYRKWRSQLLARVTQPPSPAMLRARAALVAEQQRLHAAAAAGAPSPAPEPEPSPSPSRAPSDSALHFTSTDPRVRDLETRLARVDSRISSLTTPGRYQTIKEGGETRFVTQYDSRGAAALEEAKREREQLAAELERAKAAAPGQESGPLSAEEYAEKAKLDSEIGSMTREIDWLESAGRDERPIVDEQGKRRWVKPTDSRFGIYLEGLKEKKRKLEQQLGR